MKYIVIVCALLVGCAAKEAVDGRVVLDTGVDLAACQERLRAEKAKDSGADAAWKAYADCKTGFGLNFDAGVDQ